MRLLALAYGLVAYAIFFVTFSYAIGFTGGFLVPKGIDSGAAAPIAGAVGVNAALLTIFALQHSVMARPGFKRWWTKIVPEPIERSTYVLLASLALILLFWQWRPLPQTIWHMEDPILRGVIWGLFGLGYLTVLSSTFLINHFDLFGLRQVWTYRRQGVVPPPEFVTPLFYKLCRHPLYLGFIIAFWAAPTMSLGHLLFAIATTAHILIAIQLEERDLIAVFGSTYENYRRRVGMLVPWPRRRPTPVTIAPAE